MVLKTIITHNKAALSFKEVFRTFDQNVLRWFPGHMDRGLKQIQQKLINIDCVIEVHDSRIPFSGRNPMFLSSIYVIKPHILIMNKKDLCNTRFNHNVLGKLYKEEKVNRVIYTNCKDNTCDGVKKLFPTIDEVIKNSERYNRQNSVEHNILIIGIPNVGKSSLINALRNRFLKRPNAAPVGGVPGITKSVQTKIKISESPPIYVFDTPGILTPNIPHVETGLKMALCNIMQDHLVGEDIIAKYLLYSLNKQKNYSYVEFMGLDGPCESITEILTKYAVQKKKYKKVKGGDGIIKLYPDFLFSANTMIKAFRDGNFGRMMLDVDLL